MVLLTITLATPTFRVITHSPKMSNPDWSTGLAWNVMGWLRKKCKLDDTISAVELNSRLSKLRIKVSDHPDLLFNKLVESNIAYGCQLEESRQITEIMANASKIYTCTQRTKNIVIEMSKENVTLYYLQNAHNS